MRRMAKLTLYGLIGLLATTGTALAGKSRLGEVRTTVYLAPEAAPRPANNPLSLPSDEVESTRLRQGSFPQDQNPLRNEQRQRAQEIPEVDRWSVVLCCPRAVGLIKRPGTRARRRQPNHAKKVDVCVELYVLCMDF